MGEKDGNTNRDEGQVSHPGYSASVLGSANKEAEANTITSDVNFGSDKHQPQIKQLKAVVSEQERVVVDGVNPNPKTGEDLNAQHVLQQGGKYNDTLLIGGVVVLLAMLLSRK